jgi:fatty acid desaturase
VLLAVAGALVVLRSRMLPKEAQPFAAATFTSFAIIAALAWGMWQTWWMCAAPLAAIYVCFAAGSLRCGSGFENASS